MRSWIIVPAAGLLMSLLCVAAPAYSQGSPETKAQPKKEVRTGEKPLGTEEKCPPPVEIGKIREQREDVVKSRKQIEQARRKLRQQQSDLRRDLRNQSIDQQLVRLQQQMQRLERQMLELEQKKLTLTQQILQLQQRKLK